MPRTEKGYFSIDVIQIVNHADPNTNRKYGCCKLGPRSATSAQQQPFQNYICVDTNDIFQLQVNTIEKSDHEMYGAVLFLDGQRVHGKKTFSGRTFFHGFKMGNGDFKEFVFSSPKIAGLQEEDPDKSDLNKNKQKLQEQYGGDRQRQPDQVDLKYKGKKGTIILEFYKTEQFERKQRPTRVHTKEYEQHFIEDSNKKSFAEGVRIKEGKTFTLPQKIGGFQNKRFQANQGGSGGGYQQGYQGQGNYKKRDNKYEDKRGYRDNRRNLQVQPGNSFNKDPRSQHGKSYLPGGSITEEGNVIDYKILFDQVVDTIIINYAQWSYLQLMNFVDIREYDHLKLIPRSLMDSNEFVTKVLYTVVKDLGKVHFKDIEKCFLQATTHKISDYFEFRDDELKTFIKMKDKMFLLDNEGNVRVKNDYSFDQESQSSSGNAKTRHQKGGAAGNSKVAEVILID